MKYSRYVIEIDGKKNKIITSKGSNSCCCNKTKDDPSEVILRKFKKGNLILDEWDIDMMYVDYDNDNNLVISCTKGYLIIMKNSEESHEILSDYQSDCDDG